MFVKSLMMGKESIITDHGGDIIREKVKEAGFRIS